MKRKEFKVGEVFTCGLVKLRCEKIETYYCDGCFLNDVCETQGCCKELVGECGSMNREDKTDVIFVKVED